MIAISVRRPGLPMRGCLALLLAFAALAAQAAPPTDADVNRLLAASRAQTMLDSMLPQLEQMQREQFARVAAERPLTATQQAQLKQVQDRTRQTLGQALSWSQMRPMYVDLYKRTFSREDVIAMAEFYESPAGQSLLDKTPLLMRNVMEAIQQKMTPMMADLQKDLNQILAEPATAPAPAPAKPAKP
ncbi:hypothetical protein ARC20_17415 [Stenotrophomonas panacihumi]|uniref:DUF2059 domain-containing protein n=1 Tax=Stenotrophomonas panacihumi TaxID=676599 RepID=A0A0R0ASL8_9GAMM|nr:DUF2059 domain-containing protein [Stenotrophomonas panacihumi]KRG48175.1 hypothetical protein ARC20_17415 [Stenotrophomonas panacihumi]PTN54419.1 DUF2059 domain-containing protein [Stenotrophomonas panacihumi]